MSANKQGRKSVPAISGPLGPVPPAPNRRIRITELRTTDQTRLQQTTTSKPQRVHRKVSTR
ncbi:hypothetical protein BDW22DRAFT_1361686 [Trametopsis cervina]|nr:hypothetical protein BDW22DRAFT_1361686 [Trametopsis cervina]